MTTIIGTIRLEINPPRCMGDSTDVRLVVKYKPSGKLMKREVKHVIWHSGRNPREGLKELLNNEERLIDIARGLLKSHNLGDDIEFHVKAINRKKLQVEVDV